MIREKKKDGLKEMECKSAKVSYFFLYFIIGQQNRIDRMVDLLFTSRYSFSVISLNLAPIVIIVACLHVHCRKREQDWDEERRGEEDKMMRGVKWMAIITKLYNQRGNMGRLSYIDRLLLVVVLLL